MLDNQVTITVDTETRNMRITRYPDAKTNSVGRTCTTTDGESELSTGSVTSKDGSKRVFSTLRDDGNFVDNDSNRFDSTCQVSINLNIPAEGYDEAHVTNMLTGMYTFLTTAVEGETPLSRLFLGEK